MCYLLQRIKEFFKYILGNDESNYARLLDEFLNHIDTENYLVYDHLRLRGQRGEEHFIDTLLICEYGIYCVDFEDCKGRVTYNVAENLWENKHKGRIYGVYNPIFKNASKVHNLLTIVNETLDRDIRDNVGSVIVFPNNCAVGSLASNHLVITRFFEFEDTFTRNRKKCFTQDEIVAVINTLGTYLVQ